MKGDVRRIGRPELALDKYGTLATQVKHASSLVGSVIELETKAAGHKVNQSNRTSHFVNEDGGVRAVRT